MRENILKELTELCTTLEMHEWKMYANDRNYLRFGKDKYRILIHFGSESFSIEHYMFDEVPIISTKKYSSIEQIDKFLVDIGITNNIKA